MKPISSAQVVKISVNGGAAKNWYSSPVAEYFHTQSCSTHLRLHGRHAAIVTNLVVTLNPHYYNVH